MTENTISAAINILDNVATDSTVEVDRLEDRLDRIFSQITTNIDIMESILLQWGKDSE